MIPLPSPKGGGFLRIWFDQISVLLVDPSAAADSGALRR